MPAPVAFPVLAMVSVLTTSSLCVFSVTVLAPEAAPAIGVRPELVGPYVAVVYLLGMFSGAVTGALIARWGPIRVCQASMLCAAGGMAVFALGQPAAAAISAVLLGCAYGPYNPASAHVLSGLAPPRWQPFVFSVKQLGVPLGGMIAGAVAPALALALGWERAALACGGIALATIALLQPLRARFDADRVPGRPLGGASSVAGPLRLALGSPVLRRYTLASFAFAGCQVTVATFLVVYFTESLGIALVTAGAVFAFVQAGGVAGRLVWGATAGETLSPRTVLIFLGAAMALLIATMLAVGPSWPFPVMALIAFGLGMSSFGWNGVMLSEIATHAPPGMSAAATGGMQFVMFGGVTLFPLVFGVLLGLTGSYAAAYLCLAGLGIWGAALLVRMPRAPHAPRTLPRRPP